MSNDDVTNVLAGAQRLEVDVAHLDNIATYLTTVADAISTIRDGTLRTAHRAMTMGGETEAGTPSASALGSTEIRPQVEDLARRENGAFQAIDGSLKSIMENLRTAAEAVTEIAEEYQSVEDRNAATAADWAEAISG